jgi:hypothetical protein
MAQDQTDSNSLPADRTSKSAAVSWNLIGSGVAVLLLLLVGAWYFFFGCRCTDTTSLAAQEVGQTEAGFLNQTEVRNSSASTDVEAEWRAARADHKVIAYAIANCVAFNQFGNTDVMPRQFFNALLLNLTPKGDHRFFEVKRAAKAGDPKDPPGNAASKPDEKAAADAPIRVASTDVRVELSGPQQSIIFLSDAIARMRLRAVSEATANWPQMYMFGWIMLVISAAGTLFVTIKGSMTAPAKETDPRAWRRYMWIGYAAIVLSTIGTTLASVKQFYDPARTYKANGAALVELRRLHTKLGFDFIRSLDPAKCLPADPDAFQRNFVEGWQTLAAIQASVTMASANLQDADRIKLDLSPPNQSPNPNQNQNSVGLPNAGEGRRTGGEAQNSQPR